MTGSTVPSQDLAQRARSEQRLPLDAIFAPRAVAVIGATEKAGSVGRSILWNLISNPFGGTVYPVNPKRPNVLGIRAYPTIAAVPEPVDLAVVVTPAPTVPGVIGECVDGRRQGGDHHLGRVQGNRPRGGRARAPGAGAGAARADAADRAQLPGRDATRPADSTPRSPRRSPGRGPSAS